MNILITAGGNTEKIDDVRMIRNTGTGRLGALIAEKLAARHGHKGDVLFCAEDGDSGGASDSARIYYICDRHAVTPQTAGATVIHADNVTALGEAVREVCEGRRIDAVIHSMAVSDYRVKNVTTARKAADAAIKAIGDNAYADGYSLGRSDGILFDLWSLLKNPRPEEAGWLTKNAIAGDIAGAPDIRDGGKISSDLDDVLVVLERAPKIISLFRGLAPDAVIVGFKLLSDVSEEELIRVGKGLLQKNDCDYVLANDTKYLKRGGHLGHLIARDGSHRTYDGKEAIAEAIAKAVLRNAH
jgi:phosphopantothenate-cysteine ligase